METYRFNCQVGDDGQLTLKLPLNLRNADVEVVVVVQLVKQHTTRLPSTQEKPERGLENFPNTYQDWTPEDDQQLLALLDEGMSVQAIAYRLGRRPRSVEARSLRLERRLKDSSQQGG